MKIRDCIKYVVCTLVVICVVACTTDEQEWGSAKDMVQVVGRVTAFEDHSVTSRALKTNEESKINNMSLFIFEEGGNCVSQQYVNSSRPVFVIDRSKLTGALDKTKIYMLANVGEIGNVGNLDALQAYTCEVGNSIDVVPENGFPMMGHMDDVNLTQGNTNLSAVLEIPLTCLYAKMVFNLQVNTVQSVVGYVPAFRLESWEVHNMPKTVALAESEFSNVEEYYDEAFVSNESTGSNPVSGSGTLSFSFYLPEHKIKANTWNDYPANITDDEKQRFKPKRVEEGTKPTFVRIKGSFSNHQGHMQNVSYDIYLGLDNWENFQVLRNYQYNNNIIIKGITNSTDSKEGSISIDHRVNVERSEFTVAMERETMLDCHFEVRPMRVKLNGDGKVVAKVQQGCDWIRLETKKTGGTNHCANGKRKYFTTTLMTDLDNTATVTSNDNNCIWAYIDENTNIEEAQDGVRTATVTFSYYADVDADVATTAPIMTETYTFAQRYLYPVWVDRDGDGTKETVYYIEYFEEYLYDFDSENDFGLTNEKGMKWGLNDTKISKNNKALYYTGSNKRLVDWVMNNSTPYYDFYISKAECANPVNGVANVDYFPYSGLKFTKQIVNEAGHLILSLETQPRSAAEYCYNRNKRNNDGTINQDGMNWYLPAIDEIQDIVKEAYTEFSVFQNEYYWSSQPAYIYKQWSYDGILGGGSGNLYDENINAARATSVLYSGTFNGEKQYNVAVSTDNTALVTMIWKWWGLFDFHMEEVNIEGAIMNRGPGYHSRNEENRIRAVYKP